MTEPIVVDAGRLFEFIDRPGLAVLLVSVHARHAFSTHLAQQLATEHQEIVLGTISLADLVTGGGSALPFLQQQFRASEISTFGVLPGYCLFRGAELVSWDAGLPGAADVTSIVQSALLGVLFSTFTSDVLFVVRALHLAIEQTAAPRIALRFREAASASGRRQARAASAPPPIDQLRWAYDLLGVTALASDHEVHQAWRRKRVQMHPDTAAGDAAEFERRSRLSADINRARDIIISHRARGEGRPHAA